MNPLRRWFGRRGGRGEPAGDGSGNTDTRAALGDPERIAVVEAVLDELRPLFRADGGDMQLVSIDDEGWVHVRTRGACAGCGVSELTLRGAIEPRLRARCPWLAGVRSV